MANFYAIFNRSKSSGPEAPQAAMSSTCKLLGQIVGTSSSVPGYGGTPEEAHVARIEATSLAEAQQGINHYFPGQVTGTPVIVTEAQFKES